jgi:hypothetical protein
MSSFKLPKSWCYELQSFIAKFWWGQRESEHRIHWVKWMALCRPKHAGGIGFRDLHSFNLALLAKQGWRLLTNTSSLFYRVFKPKYFPHGNFLHASVGSNSSYIWKNFMAAQPLLRQGSKWKVGNGSHINIWLDG